MAFTIGSLQLNAESAGALKVPAIQIGSYRIGAMVLPPFQFTAATPITFRIPSPTFSESGPGTLTWAASGGIAVTGRAQNSSLENGVVKYEPYLQTGAGGAQMTGVATVSFTNISSSEYYPLGGMKATGTATVGWGRVQFNASGGAQVTGAATVAFGGATVCRLNATLPKLSVVMSDGLVHRVLVGTLPKLTANFAASIYTDTATLSSKLPVLSASLSGTAGTSGTLSAKVPRLTMTGAAGGSALSASFPRLTASFAALSSTTGTLSTALPVLKAALSAQAATTSVMSLTLPRPTATLGGYTAVLGALAPQLSPLQIVLSGSVATLGTLSLNTRSLTATLAGLRTPVGGMALRLQPLSFSALGYKPLSQILTQVTNTLTNSVTTYDAYPYNSFIEFGGRYLAAGPTGLYQVEVGDTDTTVPIAATIAFGETDFSSEFQKRLSDVYLGMRSDSDITVSISVDERDPLSYVVAPLAVPTIKQRRVTVGKGLKGKYWQFSLSNTNGANFDFDTMNIAAVPLDRRI